jgi:hypothetical protein
MAIFPICFAWPVPVSRHCHGNPLAEGPYRCPIGARIPMGSDLPGTPDRPSCYGRNFSLPLGRGRVERWGRTPRFTQFAQNPRRTESALPSGNSLVFPDLAMTLLLGRQSKSQTGAARYHPVCKT